MPTIEILFGAFDSYHTTGFHSRGWWFFPAVGVRLAGDTVTRPLRRYLPEAARRVGTEPPGEVDRTWLLSVLPIAIGCTEAGLPLGVVAARAALVGGLRQDTSYPLILVCDSDEPELCFSALGPDLETVEDILQAFAQRLVWGETRCTR